MKMIISCILLASCTLIMSCGSSQEVISFWKNPKSAQEKKYKSVFIIAVTPDRDARNIVETDLAIAANAKGLSVTRSIDAFPGKFTNDILPSKDEVREKIKESKCEAVFTVSLLDEKSEQRFIPDATTYAGGYGYSPYSSYSYYGSYSTYVAFSFPMTSTPGYYDAKKRYFLEGNLYDAVSEEIRWSMQSSAYDPSDLGSASRDYARLLIHQLEKK